MVCRDPTCGYSRRLEDLSPQEQEIKKEYFRLRTMLFEYASTVIAPPTEVVIEYNILKVKYNKIKHYDFNLTK